MTNESMPPRLAVLIDADNISHKIADSLFAHIAKLGDASVRRIYGDFSSTHAKGWDAARVKHAIVPHQQFANVPGKNATDITLVIDAMDLLHAGGLDGFCVVSSDSDFTRLATRMREHGLTVFGFGRKETSASFRQACREFVDTDALVPKPAVKPTAPVIKAETSAPTAKKASTAAASIADAERLLLRVLGELRAGGSWVAIETIHHQALKLEPGFKPATYGSKKLRNLVDRIACLESKDEGTSAKVRMKVKGAPVSVASKTVPDAAKPLVREDALALS